MSKKIIKTLLITFVLWIKVICVLAQSGGGFAFTASIGDLKNAKLGQGYGLSNSSFVEGSFAWRQYYFIDYFINISFEPQISYSNFTFLYDNYTDYLSQESTLAGFNYSEYLSWNRYSFGLIGSLNLGRPVVRGGNLLSGNLKAGVLYNKNRIDPGKKNYNLNVGDIYQDDIGAYNWSLVYGVEFKMIFLSVGCKYEIPLTSVLNHKKINELSLNSENQSYLRGLNLTYPRFSIYTSFFIDWPY